MHNDGFNGIACVVEDVYFLLRAFTTAHIIKLQIIAVGLDVAEHEVVGTAEVHHLSHHSTAHCEHEGRLSVVGVNVDELLETAHCLRIVGDTHHECGVADDFTLGIIHRGAAATCAHIAYAYAVVVLVLYFKFGGDGSLVGHLSAIHHLVYRFNPLCIGTGNGEGEHRSGNENVLHIVVSCFFCCRCR